MIFRLVTSLIIATACTPALFNSPVAAEEQPTEAHQNEPEKYGNDPTIPSAALNDFLTPLNKVIKSPGSSIDIRPGPDGRFAVARFVDVELQLAAAELGKAANANVVVSQSVATQRITVSFRNIDLNGILKALAVTQNLVARHDDESDIHFLAAPDEVRSDLAAFQTTQTEVFTLLYPNARDVVRAIRGAFDDRVVVTEEDEDDDQTIEELENRFRRFEIFSERVGGFNDTGSNSANNNRTRSKDSRFRNDRFNDNRSSNRANGQINLPRMLAPLPETELTPEEARLLAAARTDGTDAEQAARRLATRRSLTYVTAIQRLNRIVVRSGDPHTMREIQGLINRMDMPTPLVLLEVRVMRIRLSDGLEAGVDFAFQRGDASGAFSTGEIAAPPTGSVLPGGTGVNLSAGVFQIVSDNFQARLQALQNKGRLTSLASPILLTANNEVSRIFSGEQIPITTGFSEPQVIVADGATTTIPGSPITELRDIGTDLLITANINADRTVTLRLVQKTSQINTNGGTILVPNGTTFTTESIDTVQNQSASGTIVARDGLLLAFGGLIEETETDQRSQIPILGDIPLIGFLFRRESSAIVRSELIVTVRPYVLSTPVEGDQISRNLLKSLSIHPYQLGEGAATGEPDDWGVFREGTPQFNRSLFDLFRFHTTPSINNDN
jgi:general secretion pathway protein D